MASFNYTTFCMFTTTLFLHIEVSCQNYVLAVTQIDCTVTVQKIKFLFTRLEELHRRSQYEANRGTRLIRLIILEDFIRLISYNGPCVRLGCSFFLATALNCSTESGVGPFFTKRWSPTSCAWPNLFEKWSNPFSDFSFLPKIQFSFV